MAGKMKTVQAGFTLVELLVILVLTGCIAALAMPAFSAIRAQSRAQRCSANIQLIEAAKDAYIKDKPGQALNSQSQLLPYLKYGMPSCPSGGTYNNVLNAYARTSCSADTTGIDGMHDYGAP